MRSSLHGPSVIARASSRQRERSIQPRAAVPARREAHPVRMVVEMHERERFTNALVQQRGDVMEIARAEQRDRRFDLCAGIGESLPCLRDRRARDQSRRLRADVAQVDRAHRLPRRRIAER